MLSQIIKWGVAVVDTCCGPTVAELRVNRDRGLFETVTVPFEVRSADNEVTTSDLSPLMGSALVFNPEDSFRVSMWYVTDNVCTCTQIEHEI